MSVGCWNRHALGLTTIGKLQQALDSAIAAFLPGYFGPGLKCPGCPSAESEPDRGAQQETGYLGK